MWQPLVNRGTSDDGLVTTELTGLDINTTTTISLTGGGPPVTDIRGALSSFTLSLVDGLVTVVFDSLAFTSHAGAAPKLDVKISKVAPGNNAVAFFQRLLDNLPGAGDIPHIDYRDSSLIQFRPGHSIDSDGRVPDAELGYWSIGHPAPRR